MVKYSAFAPTGFDVAGLNGNALDRSNWFVLDCIGRNRDSDIASDVNFDCAVNALLDSADEGEGFELHRFGHWACGWFEIILINPECESAMAAAESIESALDNYPILDDDELSNREMEEVTSEWDCASLLRRIEIAHDANESIFAARHDIMSDRIFDHMRDSLYRC